jgi:hypothetical protein
MSSAEAKPDAEKSEGQRWLELLGRGDLVGTPIPYYKEGRQLRAEEFPILDRDAVLPIFTYIESLAPDDPKREEYIEAARATLDHYMNQPAGNA